LPSGVSSAQVVFVPPPSMPRMAGAKSLFDIPSVSPLRSAEANEKSIRSGKFPSPACDDLSVRISLLFAAFVFHQAIFADAITDLHSPDINVRRTAIAHIQTMDDPRIPAACLPLLEAPGFSIQRLAARSLGSRFDQIAPADRPRYLTALRACLEKRKKEPILGTYGDDGITLMCQRAIGLITQKYDSPPFSISPDGNWVLYERRRRPVVANTASQQHHLLAPLNPDGPWNDEAYYSEDDDDDSAKTNLLKTVDTNLSAKDLFAPHWRSDSNALAFTLERMQARFYHPIMVWTASAPAKVKVLDEAYFQSLLGKRYPQWGTTTEFAGWHGSKVLIRVYNCDYPEGGHPPDPGLIVSYNSDDGAITLEK
jgi:hypothetical protein